MAEQHQHLFIQISLGFADVSIDGKDFTNVAGFAVASKTDHQIHRVYQTNFTLLIDQASEIGQLVHRHWFEEQNYKVFADLPTINATELTPWLQLVKSLLPEIHVCQDIDKRVLACLEALQQDVNLDLTELALKVHLSPSRLSALIRQQLGVPFRSLLLQTKINKAITLLSQGGNITDMALLTGFNDSAHFSNTFKKTFGSTAKKQQNQIDYHYLPQSLSLLLNNLK